MSKKDREEFVNILHDWGFKYIFKRKAHKDLLITFLNDLLQGEQPITDVEYQDTDLQSEFDRGRNVAVDLLCTGSDGKKYLVEMQYGAQSYIVERVFYYGCKLYTDSGEKGDWDYQVKGVISICILNFILEDDEKIRTDYELIDTIEHHRRYDKFKIVFLQVPRISTTFESCKSETEKWLYLFKNMKEMKYKTPANLKKEFTRLLEIARVAALSDKDRREYDALEKHYRDYMNQMDYAEKKGIQAGFEKGMEKGMRKGLQQGIQQGVQQGI